MPERPRFAYCVSGNGGLLKETIRAVRSGLLPLELVVVADRNCGALDIARNEGYETALVEFDSCRDRAEFQARLHKVLVESGASHLVLNFNRLVDEAVTLHFVERSVNAHFALLPMFPGFGAIPKSVASGARFAGVTFHQIDASMDGGPIISQGISPVLPGDDKGSLGKRLFSLAVPIQIQCILWMLQDRLSPTLDKTVRVKDGKYDAFPASPAVEREVLDYLAASEGGRAILKEARISAAGSSSI